MAREDFLTEMQARLKDFDERLARLEARPKPAAEAARLEREKTACFLKANRAELAERLKQARYTPDASWQEFKASMRRMYDDMSGRVEEA